MALSNIASGFLRRSMERVTAFRPATACVRRMAVRSGGSSRATVQQQATVQPTPAHPPCVPLPPAAVCMFNGAKFNDAAGASEAAASDLPDMPLHPNEPASFTKRAARFGVKALLGPHVHIGRFDRVLEGMTVVHIDSKAGRVLCELPVDEVVQNSLGTLHGGCSATLVDVVGSMALLTKNPKNPGVSVDLAVKFCSAGKAGATVTIEGRVLKAGRRLGLTQVDIRGVDGTLLATGTLSKAF